MLQSAGDRIGYLSSFFLVTYIVLYAFVTPLYFLIGLFTNAI